MKTFEQLRTAYPNLYRDLSFLRCGVGWLEILADLSKQISEKFPSVYAVQVKEKFGGLRFYYQSDAEDFDAPQVDLLVKEAEARAWKTCERCGAESAETPVKNYWRKTLCPSCNSKRESMNDPDQDK